MTSSSEMRPIRSAVYGVGEMESIVTRLLVEHGAETVGAIAASKTKVCREIGEVASLGKMLGIVVEENADEVLSCSAVARDALGIQSFVQFIPSYR